VPGYGPSSYEVVPYKGRPSGESHPDTLATIATLFGMKPPSVPHARVLEIGCASGENLVPMAAELPEGRFLGIDSSERQVAEGRATIEAAGLGNVALRRMDLLDAGPELGTFDYIVSRQRPWSDRHRVPARDRRRIPPPGTRPSGQPRLRRVVTDESISLGLSRLAGSRARRTGTAGDRWSWSPLRTCARPRRALSIHETRPPAAGARYRARWGRARSLVPGKSHRS